MMANTSSKLASWSYPEYKKNLMGVVRINQVKSLDGRMSPAQGPEWGKVKVSGGKKKKKKLLFNVLFA